MTEGRDRAYRVTYVGNDKRGNAIFRSLRVTAPSAEAALRWAKAQGHRAIRAVADAR